MQWSELFDREHKPLDYQIEEFTGTPLWEVLTTYLQQTYSVQPELFHSSCSMKNGFWKGWNVKYKKSGKSLCTLYPKQDYFIALIPVSAREMVEAELLIPLCEEYTQELYRQTKFGAHGKSLPVAVTTEDILYDVKALIALRSGSGFGQVKAEDRSD